MIVALLWALGALGNVAIHCSRHLRVKAAVIAMMALPVMAFLVWPAQLPGLRWYPMLLGSAVLGALIKAAGDAPRPLGRDVRPGRVTGRVEAVACPRRRAEVHHV